MATNEAWGRELRRARDAWEERHRGKLTLQDFGARVAKLSGRQEPFSHPAVASWFAGTLPRSPDVVSAIIRAVEGDPQRFRDALVSHIPVTQNPPAPGIGGAGGRKRGNGRG